MIISLSLICPEEVVYQGFKLNFIDRLFGKKEETPQEIAFEELSNWLESRSGKIFKSFGKHASHIFSRIEKALVEIEKSTDELEKAEPVGKFHLRMVKITTSNRDNMVKQVRMLIEKISIPESTDIKTIKTFHENTMHNLLVCLDNMMKSHQYAKTVYPEASKEVIAEVNALRRLLDELINPLNDRKDTIYAFENADNIVQEIKQTQSGIVKKEKSITKQEENVAVLKNELVKLQESIHLLRESQLWNEYGKVKDELEILGKKVTATEAKIKALVLPLSAGLNRLKQLSESGRHTLSPETKQDLQACFSDPKNVNPEFFVGFKNIIESDALNLSPDKKNKMLGQVNPVISSLGQLQENYRIAVQDVEKKEKELSVFDIHNDEKRMTDEKTALQNKIETSEKELETAKHRLISLKDDIEFKKQELQQVISSIDSNLRVSF